MYGSVLEKGGGMPILYDRYSMCGKYGLLCR